MTPAPVVEAKTLTQEQIDAALLTQNDVPAGSTLDTTTGEEVTDEETDVSTSHNPPECKEIVEGLGEGKGDREPQAQGDVSFGNEEYQFMAETIEVWDATLNAAALDELTTALTQCGLDTTTDADGTVGTATVTALDMPNYGDRTLAVRVVVGSASGGFDLSLTIDVVVAASGNVSVSVLTGAFAPVDPAVLQKVLPTARRRSTKRPETSRLLHPRTYAGALGGH